MEKWAIKVGAVMLLSLAFWLDGCSSGSGEQADMLVTVERDASCNSIAEFLISAKEPYDRAFSGTFGQGPVSFDWVDMPEDEFPLVLELMSANATFDYSTSISKTWGESATFTAVCDEGVAKPALLYNLAELNAIFTTPAECRWFTSVEFFEEREINKDTGQAMLSRLFTGDMKGDRTLFYWHDPEFSDYVFHVKLTDLNNKKYGFRFIAALAWDTRFDFNVLCDTKTGAVDMEMLAGGQSYTPSPVGSDGDIDGDADGDSTADGDMIPDGDGESPDGDIVPDGDVDAEAPDGDIDGDLDQMDGDVEAEMEEEAEQPCGQEDPAYYATFEAEDRFLKEESNPSDKARFVNTSGEPADGDSEFGDEEVDPPYENPNINGDGYIILEAEQVGGELVFSFDIPQDWEYLLHIGMVGGKESWGEASIFIDDQSEPLLLYNGNDKIDLDRATTGMYNEWPMGMSDFQPVCLTAGEHRLRVRVVGTQSSGYTIGVDRISLSSD